MGLYAVFFGRCWPRMEERIWIEGNLIILYNHKKPWSINFGLFFKPSHYSMEISYARNTDCRRQLVYPTAFRSGLHEAHCSPLCIRAYVTGTAISVEISECFSYMIIHLHDYTYYMYNHVIYMIIHLQIIPLYMVSKWAHAMACMSSEVQCVYNVSTMWGPGYDV